MFLINYLASHDHVFKEFGDYRFCCSRDITGLIFHLILREHVIKGLCEFMEGSFTLSITTLPSLMATGIVAMGKSL